MNTANTSLAAPLVQRHRAKAKYRLCLFIILLVAFGIRIYRLDFQSLWGDELATWWEVWRPNFDRFWETYRNLELTPPLYFLVEFAWSRLTLASEWSLRLPSVIFGMGFVIATGYFAGELAEQNRKLATLAGAAFAATSYRAITMSREARCYSLLFLLSAVSGWAWLRVNWQSEKRRDLRGGAYVIAAVLLCYTHYFGVLMVASQALSAIRSGKTCVKNWLMVYGAIGICFFPWLLILLGHRVLSSAEPRAAPSLSEFFVAHRELFGSSSINSSFALLLSIGAIFFANRRSRPIAVLSWVGLTFIFAWTFAQWAPVYSSRSYMVALAPMLAISAAGCSAIKFRKYPLGALATFVFCLLGLHETLIGREVFREPEHEQIRQATYRAVEILKSAPESALAVVDFSPFVTDFYMQRAGSPRRFETQIPTLSKLASPSAWPPEIQSATQLIAMSFTYNDLDFARLYANLSPELNLVSRTDFHHVSVALFTRNPANTESEVQ